MCFQIKQYVIWNKLSSQLCISRPWKPPTGQHKSLIQGHTWSQESWIVGAKLPNITVAHHFQKHPLKSQNVSTCGSVAETEEVLGIDNVFWKSQWKAVVRRRVDESGKRPLPLGVGVWIRHDCLGIPGLLEYRYEADIFEDTGWHPLQLEVPPGDTDSLAFSGQLVWGWVVNGLDVVLTQRNDWDEFYSVWDELGCWPNQQRLNVFGIVQWSYIWGGRDGNRKAAQGSSGLARAGSGFLLGVQ